MGEDIKLSVIKKTQDSLGKFIKRPPLTEKLLKKPPFRFLHDIVTAVIRQHGLMEGLFTAEEMVSDNVKDRESKIAFLQKVIDTMKLLTGPSLAVRPSKIVAGQEAEKTNELLQAIAKALEKKVNSKKAVDQVLGKSKDGAAGPKTSSNATSKVKEQTEVAVNGKPPTKRKDSKSTDKKERSKAGSKEGSRKTKEVKPVVDTLPINNGPTELAELAPIEQPLSLGAAVEEEMISLEPSAPDMTLDTTSLPPRPETKAEVPAEMGELARESKEDLVPNQEDPAFILESSDPVAELGKSTPVLGGGEEPQQISPDTSVSFPPSTDPSRAPTAVASSPAPRPASTRPGSARPRPLTARPAAPRLKERVVRPAREEQTETATVGGTNIILDSGGSKQEDEDDEVFVVEEAEPATQGLPELPEPATLTLAEVSEGGEQGRLVSQIIGTQRALQDEQDTKDAAVDGWSGREVAHKEVGRLREAVQGLVRAANPLGRLLDFLQEDVESMQAELEQWQSENQTLRADIAREGQITAESLLPLEKELAELNSQVEQQKQSNGALKTVVIFNDQNLLDSLLKD